MLARQQQTVHFNEVNQSFSNKFSSNSANNLNNSNPQINRISAGASSCNNDVLSRENRFAVRAEVNANYAQENVLLAIPQRSTNEQYGMCLNIWEPQSATDQIRR